MIGIFGKFYSMAGEQKKNFYAGLAFSVLHAFFEAIRIPAIAVVLAAILEGNMTAATVWTSLGIMAVSVAGCALTRMRMTILQTIGGYTMAANKRVEIGERLKYMPMGYFNDNSLGAITSVTTNTLDNMQEVATRVIMLVSQGILTTSLITLAILIYDWRVGLIVVLGILLFFGMNAVMQHRSRHLAPRKVEADSRLVESVLEYIQGIGVVKSYNLDQVANKKVDRAIVEDERINYHMEKTFVPYTCAQSIILKLSGVAVIFAAISFYIGGTMELVNCLLMVISSFMIFSSLDSAGSFSALLRMLDNSMDRVSEIFDTPVMDIDGTDIVPESCTIEGKDICFSYDKKTVIDGVSFSIPQGTTTAVIGPSGSGKTTLCHLMSRFWDVDAGIISLGGRNVTDYTLDSLLKNFSMVFQSVYLFNDTIANNIRFGKPGATMEEIQEAAKQACCHDFISRLPDGYNTVIGEGGATISGGEKQRISIARALLKDAPIIILDEATANVDPENEQQLQKAIEALTRNKTIIMIAHRLKTVQNANQILVLDGGRIIQRGTHGELMKQGGIYADFINMRESAIGWKLGAEAV